LSLLLSQAQKYGLQYHTGNFVSSFLLMSTCLLSLSPLDGFASVEVGTVLRLNYSNEGSQPSCPRMDLMVSSRWNLRCGRDSSLSHYGLGIFSA